MTKLLTFKVEIEGLEDKIWRKVEITDRRTMADLAYAVLSTFRSLADHLYNIEYKGKCYDCWIGIEDDCRDIKPINAIITRLGEIGLEENDTMVMNYDNGSPTTFKITYLGQRDFEKGTRMRFPEIVDGAGYGMIDDLTNSELKDIVEEIDKKGTSDYEVVCKDQKGTEIYDYRNFDLEENNAYLKKCFLKIKYSYEDEVMK